MDYELVKKRQKARNKKELRDAKSVTRDVSIVLSFRVKRRVS